MRYLSQMSAMSTIELTLTPDAITKPVIEHALEDGGGRDRRGDLGGGLLRAAAARLRGDAVRDVAGDRAAAGEIDRRIMMLHT